MYTTRTWDALLKDWEHMSGPPFPSPKPTPPLSSAVRRTKLYRHVETMIVTVGYALPIALRGHVLTTTFFIYPPAQ
jgi:hypothetical protein